MKRALNTRFAAILTLTATLICALIAGVTVLSFSSGVASAASDYAASWANYINESRDNHTQVTFTLTDGDWTAGSSGFGEGDGFTDGGKLKIPVGADVILDLNGSTIDGNGIAGSVITVEGTLTVEDNSESGGGKIIGGSAENGGGVFVAYNKDANQSGTFILNNGEISANTATGNGGAVFVDSNGGKLNGKFVMNGGKIYTNNAANGAGVAINKTGLFELNEGIVSENEASVDGGGVYIDGVDKTLNGKFVMNGGQISNNKAEANGAGVAVSGNGSFELNKGTISGNAAKNEDTATLNGGGVYVLGKFSMVDGAISDNKASNGGGVHINDGSFNMTGGSISENTATKNGGGINIAENGALTMSGGVISGNTATENGGGVSVYGSFSVSSMATVKGNYLKSDKAVNNNVWLNPDRNCKIKVSGEMQDGARIGVTDSVNEFIDGYSGSKAPWNYFFSDSGKVISVKDSGAVYINTALTVIAAPGFSNGYSFVYTGDRIYVSNTLSEDDQGKIAVEGDLSGKNVGDYAVTFTITDDFKNAFAWEDGTHVATVDWCITRQETSLPTLSKTGVNYSDGANSFTISTIENLAITLPGGWARTDNTVTVPGGTMAGKYDIVIAPDDNHCWVGGGIDPVTFSFEVVEGGAVIGPIVDNGEEEPASFIDWYIVVVLILIVVFIVAMIINIIRIRQCDRENAEIIAETDKL